MLEDDFTYVIRKALRGLEMSLADAASSAGLRESAVDDFLSGRWNESVARALAPVLGLDAGALANHPAYQPPASDHPAIIRLDLPFGGERVNAWLVDCGDGKLLIDTGCDAKSLLHALTKTCAVDDVRRVIITHNHRDHVGGLALFCGRNVVTQGPGEGNSWNELHAGDSVICGTLQIRACDLSGHANPAIGLLIGGLGVPVMAVGDALFAGSMGGCQDHQSYAMARKTLFAALARLDERSLLLCGHGPATRLSEEWQHNPFLAAMRCC